MTTYYESAQGVKVSKERAILELKRHGLFREEDVKEFLADCGDRAEYDAGEVLHWLGY